MATIDRLNRVDGYTPWTPSAAGMATDTDYIGRHRKPDARRASMLRMFYSAKHRAR